MPRLTIGLFSGTLLIFTVGQYLTRQSSFHGSLPATDLFLTLTLLFYALKSLTDWLSRPVKPRPEDDSESSKRNNRPPHDTTL